MLSGWLSDLKFPKSFCFGDFITRFSTACRADAEGKGEFLPLGSRHHNEDYVRIVNSQQPISNNSFL